MKILNKKVFHNKRLVHVYFVNTEEYQIEISKFTKEMLELNLLCFCEKPKIEGRAKTVVDACA